jgi:hypothetical protein
MLLVLDILSPFLECSIRERSDKDSDALVLTGIEDGFAGLGAECRKHGFDPLKIVLNANISEPVWIASERILELPFFYGIHVNEHFEGELMSVLAREIANKELGVHILNQ